MTTIQATIIRAQCDCCWKVVETTEDDYASVSGKCSVRPVDDSHYFGLHENGSDLDLCDDCLKAIGEFLKRRSQKVRGDRKTLDHYHSDEPKDLN